MQDQDLLSCHMPRKQAHGEQQEEAIYVSMANECLWW